MTKNAIAYRVQDETPWIGLPATKVTAGASLQDMMKEAHLLDWDVRLRLVDTDARSTTDAFEVIRTNPFDGGLDRLGFAGERYVCVQNEDLADMAKNITDGGATADVLGSYRDGKSVFMSFTLGDDIVLDPNGSADQIGRYLNLVTSHDSSSAIVAFTGNMRLKCQNMLTSARSAALSMFKMRHTQSVEGRMLDARKALGISFKASEVFAAEMELMIQKSVSDALFWDMVKTVYPEPEKDVRGSLKKWENKTDELMGLWNGETMDNLEDTAYKAYNVFNEHLRWYTGIRAENVENALVRASGFDEASNKKDLGFFNAVKTMAFA